jgi:hypothetical protein
MTYYMHPQVREALTWSMLRTSSTH